MARRSGTGTRRSPGAVRIRLEWIGALPSKRQFDSRSNVSVPSSNVGAIKPFSMHTHCVALPLDEGVPEEVPTPDDDLARENLDP